MPIELVQYFTNLFDTHLRLSNSLVKVVITHDEDEPVNEQLCSGLKYLSVDQVRVELFAFFVGFAQLQLVEENSEHTRELLFIELIALVDKHVKDLIDEAGIQAILFWMLCHVFNQAMTQSEALKLVEGSQLHHLVELLNDSFGHKIKLDKGNYDQRHILMHKLWEITNNLVFKQIKLL